MLKGICSVFALPAAARGRLVVQASQPARPDIRGRLHWGFRPLSLLMAALLVGISALSLCSPVEAAAVNSGQNRAVAKPAVKSAEIPLNCPAQFITAMVPDGQGGVWVSGEDAGIYHGKLEILPTRHSNQGAPSGPPGLSRRAANRAHIRVNWKHFDKANSPGLVSNSICSLCMDHRGRLWAGTNRHGVCVFNGQKWQHYGLLSGPLGSHVVAIGTDPRDGSVWTCTESGVSIYMPRDSGAKSRLSRLPYAARVAAKPMVCGRWRYISRLNGLPANPDCVAFNKQGTAFVGTLCGGLAISPYPYTRWRIIHGPWHMPGASTGYGLPSNLINCVLVV